MVCPVLVVGIGCEAFLRVVRFGIAPVDGSLTSSSF